MSEEAAYQVRSTAVKLVTKDGVKLVSKLLQYFLATTRSRICFSVIVGLSFDSLTVCFYFGSLA